MRGGVLFGMILAVGLGTMAAAEPVGRRPDLDQLAGVYKHRFDNGDISGDHYRSEDVFEVVELSPRTAYFRIHTEFFNGHQCALWGVADLEADALVYTSPEKTFDGHTCVLKFRSNREGVVFDDVDGYCREGHCGARGGFGLGEHADFKFADRRRIRYMPIILKSHEYLEAVKAHGGPGPRKP